MLIDFLFELRARKLPVSTHEWMALMEALPAVAADAAVLPPQTLAVEAGGTSRLDPSAMQTAIFGSTAEAVVRHASCPVLVVKPPPEEASDQ